MTARSRLLTLLAALLPAFASAEPPKPPKPPTPAVAASTKTAAAPMTVDEMYPAGKLRDPFSGVDAGGGGKPAASSTALMQPEDFSIHSLELKGVMEDRTGGFAVLTDPRFGATFMLKRGRLFNAKNKPVPGVTGAVIVKKKTVHLMTRDRDVQVLILGEKDEAKDKP